MKEQIKKAATTAYGLNNRDYPAGEVKNLSIVVGRIDTAKNYTNYDVYNYKVSRALTLKSLQIKKEGGEVLPISPAYNAKALPMEKEYSTVYDGNNVYLDLAATTAAAQIYVGNSPYNAQTAISLSEYTEEGSDIARIPVSVQCKDAKTEYTLYISKVDYTPVITEQPHQDKPVDKDSPQPLTIEVEDYSTNEKIFYPPEELACVETPLAMSDTEGGALAYYEPWGNVVMFYDGYSENSALYELGHVVSGVENIGRMSGMITITAAEQ